MKSDLIVSNSDEGKIKSCADSYYPFKDLSCPVCHDNLDKVSNNLVCRNNHSFNISKNHSVNMLTTSVSKNVSRIKKLSIIENLGLFNEIYSDILDNILQSSNNKDNQGLNILIIKEDPSYLTKFLLDNLTKINNIIGISDYNEFSSDFYKNTNLGLIIAPLDRLPLKENYFDVVIRFDKSKVDLKSYLKHEGVEMRLIEFRSNFIEFRNILFEGRNKGFRLDSNLLKELNTSYTSKRITYKKDLTPSLIKDICSYYNKDSNLLLERELNEVTVDYLVFTYNN